MSVLEPMWLLLAVPLGVAVWVWRVPGVGTQVLRALVCVLIVLALAKLAVVLPGHGATVVVVADRSASMPPGAQQSYRELIETLSRTMRPEDRLAVVGFGREVRIEQSPDNQPFGGFISEVGTDASSLADAVEAALGLIPQGRQGRIVTLSDGRWTGRDLTTPASRAAGRGVPIDYRLLERPVVNDLAIESFEGPSRIAPEQEFLVTAHLRSPTEQPVRYELRRGERVIAAGEREAAAGRTRITFRDRVTEPGTARYMLRIRGEQEDPQLENNAARMLVGVEGVRPILLVSDKPNPALAGLLSEGGLDVAARRPGEVSASLAELGGYSAVVIEDVPAHSIGRQGLANIAEWVQHAGGGLWKTGGRFAFGQGGYYEGPLDPVLPVSMELRQEHRKLKVAVVVALDRSGSMSMGVPGGRTKMDLANLGAAQVLDMMTPMDELGVVAVDTAAHDIVPLQLADAANVGEMRDRILRIQSTGGGIYVYTALVRAMQMLNQSDAGTRHVILFADAADSQEPGSYERLLAQAAEEGVTVSVVALGTEQDHYADFLKDVANAGGGRIFFTTDANALPQLFAQDMEVVARTNFIEEPTPVQPSAGLRTVLGRVPGEVPAVGGYSLTYLKEGAQLGLVSVDEYNAPVVASWQAGLGRAVVYTGEADGEFTGPIAQWEQVGDLMTSLARWAAGDEADLGQRMMLTQRLEEGRLRVRLHLDPRAEGAVLEDMPELTILRGHPGQTPDAEQATMQYLAADELGYDVPLHGSETVIVSAQVRPAGVSDDAQPAVATLSPVTLPYPPEYAPVTDRRGAESLRQLAQSTGGIERLDVGGVWSEMSRQPRLIDLSPYLLLAAAMAFLLEVFERRTGQLSRLAAMARLRRRVRPHKTTADQPDDEAAAAERPGRRQPWWKRRPTRTPQPQPTPAANETPDTPAAPAATSDRRQPTGSGDGAAEQGAGVMAALGEASRRAKQRTRRRDK